MNVDGRRAENTTTSTIRPSDGRQGTDVTAADPGDVGTGRVTQRRLRHVVRTGQVRLARRRVGAAGGVGVAVLMTRPPLSRWASDWRTGFSVLVAVLAGTAGR